MCRRSPGRREVATWAGLVRVLGAQGWPLEDSFPTAWEQVCVSILIDRFEGTTDIIN